MVGNPVIGITVEHMVKTMVITVGCSAIMGTSI